MKIFVRIAVHKINLLPSAQLDLGVRAYIHTRGWKGKRDNERMMMSVYFTGKICSFRQLDDEQLFSSWDCALVNCTTRIRRV